MQISKARSGSKAVITLTSNTLTLDVSLFNDGVEGRFSDNFFDLHPNEVKKVDCYNLTPEELQNLKIISQYDASNS